ncbi:hypothetical protein PBY51_005096 [Eleginops maclovinus]|nr:hypothetical protein PBY51_005096 [Eleginops maclovinus]
MTLLSRVFKRWSATAGGRLSRGASCSCANLRRGTMERALFSQSLASTFSQRMEGHTPQQYQSTTIIS